MRRLPRYSPAQKPASPGPSDSAEALAKCSWGTGGETYYGPGTLITRKEWALGLRCSLPGHTEPSDRTSNDHANARPRVGGVFFRRVSGKPGKNASRPGPGPGQDRSRGQDRRSRLQQLRNAKRASRTAYALSLSSSLSTNLSTLPAGLRGSASTMCRRRGSLYFAR